MAAAMAAQKCGGKELPHVQIRGSSLEELPYFQDKDQQLYFAGAAVKRYCTSNIRETRGRQYALREAIRGQTD